MSRKRLSNSVLQTIMTYVAVLHLVDGREIESGGDRVGPEGAEFGGQLIHTIFKGMQNSIVLFW